MVEMEEGGGRGGGVCICEMGNGCIVTRANHALS